MSSLWKAPFADVGKQKLYHTHKAVALFGPERCTHEPFGNGSVVVMIL